MKKIPQSQLTALHAASKWDRPLTERQLAEFNDLADGLYQDINENRRNNGELELYQTPGVTPTIADLEFVRELSHQLA